jgi:protein-disulfide isomerase
LETKLNKYVIGAGGLVVAGLAFAGGLMATSLAPNSNAAPEIVALDTAATSPDQAAFDSQIRDFLQRNPEVVIEAQQRYAEIQAADEAKAVQAAMATFAPRLTTDPGLPVLGNPNGSKVVVEFFDYNCGYCRRAHEDVLALKASDPEIKIVLRPFPILGPESQQAHVVASAFHALMPQKYTEFHDALLTSPGTVDEGAAMAAAKSLGADETMLRAEMAKTSVNDNFGKTYEIANGLKITGTPTYVIGNTVLPGAVGLEAMKSAVAQLATN